MTPPVKPTVTVFPAVYYSNTAVVPPLVIHDQEQLDRLNSIQPGEWDTVPPTQQPATESDYPKLYFNVNVTPQVINSSTEERALSGDWRQFHFTEALAKAAAAQVKASAAATAKK